MTCRRALPASGSLFAYDALVDAYTIWRLKQEACEADHDDAVAAATADQAWAVMRRHAENCGYDAERHGSLSAWAPKRVIAYARSCGIKPEAVPGLQVGRA